MLSQSTLMSIICSISWNQHKCTSCGNSEKSTSFSISIPSVSGSISPASPRLFIRDLTQSRNRFSNVINCVNIYLKLIFVNFICISLSNTWNEINCDEFHFEFIFVTFFLKFIHVFHKERQIQMYKQSSIVNCMYTYMYKYVHESHFLFLSNELTQKPAYCPSNLQSYRWTGCSCGHPAVHKNLQKTGVKMVTCT